jgi:protein-disulfide isomerase-like protein with CxxC motif
LIRTLSEARSRATELAVSIGSRLGTEHRLTELANAAASNIENTLRDVRNAAAEKPDSAPGLADLQTALRAGTQPLAQTPVVTALAAPAGLDAEHWLHAFVDELLAQARTSGGITFESTERLLQHRKDEFLRDFLTARRMYRAYPRLFPEISDETRQVTSP